MDTSKGCAVNKLECLNESPSEKEGKLEAENRALELKIKASMKVPPKRKGNLRSRAGQCWQLAASMKVPPKRKGNRPSAATLKLLVPASMKVPPKRKGNRVLDPP